MDIPTTCQWFLFLRAAALIATRAASAASSRASSAAPNFALRRSSACIACQPTSIRRSSVGSSRYLNSSNESIFLLQISCHQKSYVPGCRPLRNSASIKLCSSLMHIDHAAYFLNTVYFMACSLLDIETCTKPCRQEPSYDRRPIDLSFQSDIRCRNQGWPPGHVLVSILFSELQDIYVLIRIELHFSCTKYWLPITLPDPPMPCPEPWMLFTTVVTTGYATLQLWTCVAVSRQ